MTKRIFAGTVLFTVVLFAVASVQAQSSSSFTFKFDENGNGSISLNGGAFTSVTGTLLPDPSNGGATALTYFLPSLETNGDVLVLESPGGPNSDAVRFTDSQGRLTGATADRLIYYSDLSDGALDKADTGFPTNLARGAGINEVGPEGNNGFSFGGSPFNTYIGISDTPEPSSFLLLGTGLLSIGGYMRRKWLRSFRQGTLGAI